MVADAVVPGSNFDSIVKLHEPMPHVGTQLSDLSFTIQTLQKQSQASRVQVGQWSSTIHFLCCRHQRGQGIRNTYTFASLPENWHVIHADLQVSQHCGHN